MLTCVELFYRKENKPRIKCITETSVRPYFSEYKLYGQDMTTKRIEEIYAMLYTIR